MSAWEGSEWQRQREDARARWCKGSYMLGTACQRCEKCENERRKIRQALAGTVEGSSVWLAHLVSTASPGTGAQAGVLVLLAPLDAEEDSVHEAAKRLPTEAYTKVGRVERVEPIALKASSRVVLDPA